MRKKQLKRQQPLNRRHDFMAIDFEAIVFVILSAAAIIGALGCVYAR